MQKKGSGDATTSPGPQVIFFSCIIFFILTVYRRLALKILDQSLFSDDHVLTVFYIITLYTCFNVVLNVNFF
jgi:hypothetical protein